MKINSFEFENVKRVKAVSLSPSEKGLTIIGGNNKQGKTSVLDAIAWTLGGNRYKPAEAQRRGSVTPPALKVTMANGLIVERAGKNSNLKVIDPEGRKSGQALLDSFTEQLALDLPRFMQSSNKEKANTLLQIIGVGDELFELEKKETELYNKRRTIGQIADQKAKFAKEQPHYPEAPNEMVSASELIKEQQEILTRNGENQRKREQLGVLKKELEDAQGLNKSLWEQLEEIKVKITENEKDIITLQSDLLTARKTVEELQDESTEELEESIENIDQINAKVRANYAHDNAKDEAVQYKEQYDDLTAEIEETRKAKTDLLTGAKLPLEGLSVEDGELTYLGSKWGDMSGAEQLIVSTSIVRELNPKCGFVLMDGLEALDLKTLTEFGQWLDKEDLQVIATRVSTGDECTVIIEDGYAVEEKAVPTWD